jgi:hypothetical protein
LALFTKVRGADDSPIAIRVIKTLREAGLTEDDSTRAAAELSRQFIAARQEYHDTLKRLRGTVGADDAKLIDRALAGKNAADFKTESLKTATRNYKASLERSLRAFDNEIVPVLRQNVAEDDEENVAYLTEIRERIGAGRDLSGARDKLTVKANADWQNLNVRLPAGSRLKITANGTWSPFGISKEDAANARKWNLSTKLENADKFKIQLRVGDETINYGKADEFTVNGGGNVEVRIANPYTRNPAIEDKFNRAGGRGALTLSLKWEPAERSLTQVEQLLAEILTAPVE